MTLSLGALTSGALGFTMALAWTDAARSLIRAAYPIETHNASASAKAALVYAAFVTVVIYFILAFSSEVAKVVPRYNNGFKSRRPTGGRPPMGRPWAARGPAFARVRNV